jgi:hypothetical protein
MDSKVRLDDVPLLVQWPEGVAEQVRAVVFSLELNESVPVVSESGFGFFWTFAATEELQGDVNECRLRWKGRMGYVRWGRDRPVPQTSTSDPTTVNDLGQIVNPSEKRVGNLHLRPWSHTLGRQSRDPTGVKQRR